MAWVSQRQAAKYLHVRLETMARLVHSGRVPACQLPGTRSPRICTDDLDALMREHVVTPRAREVAEAELRRRGEVA